MIKAYVLGKIEPNKEKAVLDEVKKIGGVKFADCTFGQYDLVIGVESTDEIQLKNLVLENIRKIPGVTSTLTLITQKI